MKCLKNLKTPLKSEPLSSGINGVLFINNVFMRLFGAAFSFYKLDYKQKTTKIRKNELKTTFSNLLVYLSELSKSAWIKA